MKGNLLAASVAGFMIMLLVGSAFVFQEVAYRQADNTELIGGPFTLQDGYGRTTTDAALQGKWSLIYFGYTHCPDTCPTALNDISTAWNMLGPDARKVMPVFITVDPERDTAAVMRSYVSGFTAPFLVLTGSTERVAKAEMAYRVYVAKRPLPGGDYAMDHSSVIFLMDPQGHFAASFTHETPPADIAARLKQLGV